ncbi:2TM domain-containing protein [Rhodoferax sp. BAB1]|uniref:2TM domain-containing protein n=1 Tax=Rhodoferax sp. BAB1 TaxID=2741720 RepID=UPI001576DFF6|nr:2TM domain-containing protein [Rhodoferax sp. BAB1]QKO22402.1 2TM domain-containing protein [Rhodoferax sp. BAB1]
MHPTSDADIDRLARRIAGAKLGWYLHATVYIAVNLLLALLSARQAHHWALYPALGWGLGLLIHGVVVWLVVPGNRLRERLVAQERKRLLAARDRW